MDKILVLSLSIILAAIIIAAAIWLKPVQPPTPATTSTTPTTTTTTTTTTTANVSGQQNMLQVQDLTFFRAVSPDGNHMNVTLQFSVKNIGEKPVELVAVRINDLNREFPANVMIDPGRVYSDAITILKNANYEAMWDIGTEHVVTFIYRIQGQPDNRTIAQKGTVQ